MARRKPSQPRQVSADLAAERAEAARLRGQGATVVQDRVGRIVRAQREDVFDRLAGLGRITATELAAVRDVERWAILAAGPSRVSSGEFVDGGTDHGGLTDAQIAAGRRLAYLRRRLGCVWNLIDQLLVSPEPWRAVTDRILGRTADPLRYVAAAVSALTVAMGRQSR